MLYVIAMPAWTQAIEAVAEEEPAAGNYLVGRGMADVTGPVVGLQLWGFGRPDQVGEGLHIRLRSRAFIIAEAGQPENRLVFASVDLGSIDHHVVLAVLEKLQSRFGETYGLHNVIISATHTHAGPTGYWQGRTDNGLDGGFYPEHYAAVVQGITDSIVRAHEDLEPGTVLINTGRLDNAGANRSEIAYLENPVAERARYADNTNTTMTLLKFTDASGDIGLVNWYALHPTAMNYYNRLVSGDHKGYASLHVERARGVRYTGDGEFVAAFAQSDPGDVTPNTNLDNTGPGATDVETTRIMGERQVRKAQELFETATEALSGPIDSRQVYVNLKGYEVADRFTGQGVQYTCPSAYGYSFAGGSTEDGGAHFLFWEGMTEQRLWRDGLVRLVTGAPAWTEEVRLCQAPKPILFETGSQDPPLQSQVHTVTVARIGQFVILAMPGEVTTMSGRRLRDTVMAELGDWAQHIVIAGYANEFAGYITTPEEYELQQYEAAHNLHGGWSLPAYQQVASQLAVALESGLEVGGQLAYDDWRGKSTELALPYHAGSDDHGDRAAGEVASSSCRLCRPGETLSVEFFSVDPGAHFMTGNNFLQVRRKTGGGWQTVATDTDWSTRVRWRFEGGRAIATLEWDIPDDITAGTYHLRHIGVGEQGKAFVGATREFSIEP
jgi:neutral ceramidase